MQRQQTLTSRQMMRTCCRQGALQAPRPSKAFKALTLREMPVLELEPALELALELELVQALVQAWEVVRVLLLTT